MLRPVLVRATVARPNIDVHSIARAAANNIQAFSALTSDERMETPIRGPGPLLVRAAVACPLVNVRPIGSLLTYDVQAQTAVLAHDGDKAT